MRKFFAVLAFAAIVALMPSMSMAQQAQQQQDVSSLCSLSATEIAKLNLSSQQMSNFRDQCENAPATATQIKETISNAHEIGDAAKDIAEAIGIAAKQLGIAVNDFLHSPAGFLTALFIFLKYFGDQAISIGLGVPILLLGWWGCMRVIRALQGSKTTYNNVPLFWGLASVKQVASVERTEFGELSDNSQGMIIAVSIVLAIFTGIMLIVIF